MDIPAYRIYNVMKVFSRRLFEEENLKRHPLSQQRPDINGVQIAADGKRRTITERVTMEIFNRLSQRGLSSLGQAGGDAESPSTIRMTLLVPEEFTYHFIDSHNRQASASMSVEDPDALIERLEYLAKEDAGHQAE